MSAAPRLYRDTDPDVPEPEFFLRIVPGHETQNSDMGILAANSTLGANHVRQLEDVKRAEREAFSAWVQQLHQEGIVFSD